uniref:LITAF domain-containing protein n=1 Tax=Denticeps clupeoides TaxID=299321 RepID=A0AAY4C403_9TELE
MVSLCCSSEKFNISINMVQNKPEGHPPPPAYQPQSPVPVYQQPQPVAVQQVAVQQVAVQPVAVQQVVITSSKLGDRPSLTTCPTCRQRVNTSVEYKVGAFAWLMCFVFIILGMVFGCCLIPFCSNTFKDAHHKCPLCGAGLDVHKRL